MPNPCTAAEWAEKCDEKPDSHHLSALYMCLHCADAYARQQVEAALERAAQIANEKCISSCWSMCHDNIAAAIRAHSR